MADSTVEITAGTGTNIDTRTESTNGNHRQVIVVGDPATNDGVAPVDATAGLKVDLGADNDVTLATLPDTAAGDLATIASQTSNNASEAGGHLESIDSLMSGVALESGGNLEAVKNNTANIPALGQALAAGSVPVVLTAAQISTLTPPAAITGFALETGGNLATIAGAVSSSKVATTIADGDSATLGAKADAKSTATDTTAVSMMSVLKEISAMEQAPASRAVTNAGTFAVQSTNQANSGVDIGDVTINNSTGGSAVNIQDGGNTITVDGTVTANATLAAETTKVIGTVNISAGQSVGITANSSVNVAQMNGVATTMGNGTSGTGVQRVTIASDSTGQVALAAGTNAIGKLTANSGVDIGDVTINNASGSAVYVQVDQSGVTSERVTNTDGNSTAFSTFTNTASTYNYIKSIVVYNSSATAGYVDFRDGTGGAVLWTMPLPAGGGATISSASPLFRTSTNTALAYDVSGALTTVYISVSGFRSTT